MHKSFIRRLVERLEDQIPGKIKLLSGEICPQISAAKSTETIGENLLSGSLDKKCMLLDNLVEKWDPKLQHWYPTYIIDLYRTFLQITSASRRL